jgi:hypothetical protein
MASFLLLSTNYGFRDKTKNIGACQNFEDLTSKTLIRIQIRQKQVPLSLDQLIHASLSVEPRDLNRILFHPNRFLVFPISDTEF